MKHLKYIYIIILLVLVAACSKDDEGILDDGSHSQGRRSDLFVCSARKGTERSMDSYGMGARLAYGKV